MTPRILIVRLGSLGDIVHALPAVAALRDTFPHARLDWLVESRWAELLELNPDLTNVFPVDTRAWRRAPLSPATWRGIGALRRMLREANYDAAIDFQGLYKSAVLARLSGAKRRIGFGKGAAKEAGAARFYTENVQPPAFAKASLDSARDGSAGRPAGVHVIDMNRALARAAGAGETPVRFTLPTSAEDEAKVEEMLRAQHLNEFVVLSPGGGWGSKCWPVERYAALHNGLARERGWRTVLNAGPGEERLVREFEAQARVTKPVHLTLTLRQLVALVKRAKVLVSGDTGPLHLAAALGTPVVGLYGPTDPARNGPYGPRAVVLHHREKANITYKHEEGTSPALLAITVEEVAAAVKRVLEMRSG
ncbi:MAG: lipopolysaccharide heptosyltransferase I [Candidatus Acidiferrales bacterium]